MELDQKDGWRWSSAKLAQNLDELDRELQTMTDDSYSDLLRQVQASLDYIKQLLNAPHLDEVHVKNQQKEIRNTV